MKMGWRFISMGIALMVGWAVYMLAMMVTVYDGFLSMIFQPFVALLFSGMGVLLAWLLGWLLKIPWLSRIWQDSPMLPIFLLVGSLLLMLLGKSMGISQEYRDLETGASWTGLHSYAAVGSYFVLLFTLTNWPVPRTLARARSAAA